MLKPERAQELLNEWRLVKLKSQTADEDDDLDTSDEDDEQDAAPPPSFERLKKLPAKLRDIGLHFIGRNADGTVVESDYRNWTERAKKNSEMTKALGELSVKDRAKVFEAFIPPLAKAMEGAWQLLASAPYQEYNGAFRAPKKDNFATARRASWLPFVTRFDEFRAEAIMPTWLAAWAPHLSASEDDIAYVLAATIDAGGKEGDEVLKILKESASNQHEIGHMGDHVTRALLTSSRPEAWEFMEKLLLAAQRQEGLRQSILEKLHESHPDAFLRIAKLILDQGLTRFSAVVRAIDVWFGLMWDSVSTKVVNDSLRQVIEYLEDPQARHKALAGKDPEAAYFALWAAAFRDAPGAVKLALPLLKDKKVEKRFAAVTLLRRIRLPESAQACAAAIDDEDLRVALVALDGAGSGEGLDEEDSVEIKATSDMFERLERLLARMPDKPTALKPLVWPWTKYKADRKQVASAMLDALGKRSPSKLLPLLPILDTWQRGAALKIIVDQKKYDDETRQVILKFASDPNDNVREHAIAALAKSKLKPDEAPLMEKALTRKTADVRRAVLGVLLAQDDKAALASADRLLEAGDANQRLAGLELLRLMIDADRQVAACQQRGESFRAARKKVTKEEETHLTAIAKGREVKVTLDDCLGLLDPVKLTKRTPPKARKVQFFTPAALACLKSLDEFVHEHRKMPMKGTAIGQEENESMLGECRWGFWSQNAHQTREENEKRIPLKELWEQWYADRPKATRDKDGLELVRALTYMQQRNRDEDEWKDAFKAHPAAKRAAEEMNALAAPPKMKYDGVVADVIEALDFLHPSEGRTEFLLDAAESAYAMVPAELVGKPRPPVKKDKDGDDIWDEKPELWTEMKPFTCWADAININELSATQRVRWWKLAHWADQAIPGERRDRPSLELLIDACKAGEANEADVIDHLIGPRSGPGEPSGREYGYRWRSDSFESLQTLTQRHSKDVKRWFAEVPQLANLVDRVRERVLEIELARGDTPTVATKAARELLSLVGLPTLLRVLTELGKTKFKKERWSVGESRPAVLTHLLSIIYPSADETPETFAAAVAPLRKEGLLDDARLAQLAFIANQWLPHIEHAFGWQGFAEGVYWFLAHMKYADTSLDEGDSDDDEDEARPVDEDGEPQERLSPFEKIVAARTPLTAEQRREGAVDVGWFQKTYELLGPKRWELVSEAGKFAASSQSAAKAQLIGDVVLGKASKAKLISEIKQKKLKNSVRLLGLLPLPAGAKRQEELIARYKILQEYQRYARGLSSLTKPEAMRAFDIGLSNLASTAGFADPLRMSWALEAESLADLRKGPLSVTHDGVTATLSLTEQAHPQMAYAKKDKVLKSLPPNVKKNKKVAELLERHTELKRQASRVKKSLEDMLCRGDTFTGDELKKLATHPLIWPHLSRLVVVGEGILGYPDKQGQALRNEEGKFEPVKKTEALRIAHPHDLLATKNWPEWQRECFKAERLQPLKQVFRELYVVTQQEMADVGKSRRYAGQQIQPRQAMALLGQRGWRTQDGVEKTFYDLDLTASLDFIGGWGSPLDVEGLTVDEIRFYKRDSYKAVPLKEVPPRVFSEVMRDIDLVVSVAHRGDVDPEASASTVEMRSALLRETCDLLNLQNVELKGSHALIEGTISEYSVHLGSGGVHRQPGGSVCIVAVGAQHRGRLFLPFADDDPRTAEVISKVLLLARDHEIQDPTILQQLRA